MPDVFYRCKKCGTTWSDLRYAIACELQEGLSEYQVGDHLSIKGDTHQIINTKIIPEPEEGKILPKHSNLYTTINLNDPEKSRQEYSSSDLKQLITVTKAR